MQIMSAVAVLTKQRAVVDNQIAATDLKANEANAESDEASMARLAIVKAYETYGEAGQPPNYLRRCRQGVDFSQSITTASRLRGLSHDDAGIDVRAGGTPQLDEVIKRRIAMARRRRLMSVSRCLIL